ncbi:MAG: class I SAM-dependent methyltransferase [Syntrophaceae bacterium]|nr:class I SAM-dependent methyltransferase [Syntrophaceae bacterium]
MEIDDNHVDYWIHFWNNNPIIENENLQKQIGRTINKVPVDQNVWEKTVEDIKRIIDLDAHDNIIDLCSGNGLLSVPLAQRCKQVIAVDISKKLLDRIDTNKYKNIVKIEGDLRNIKFENDSYTKAILYFALQHFSERESILIVKSVYNWLRPGGLFFIGDILDIDKKFVFYRTKKWQKEYFNSIITRRSIGTWFKRDYFEKLASFIGFKKCQILDQPPFQINSHYRFDVIMEK